MVVLYCVVVNHEKKPFSLEVDANQIVLCLTEEDKTRKTLHQVLTGPSFHKLDGSTTIEEFLAGMEFPKSGQIHVLVKCWDAEIEANPFESKRFKTQKLIPLPSDLKQFLQREVPVKIALNDQ
ncbi:hypothetical protein THRCLA_22124 [Thraustotheca clavata]|uniref:Crinkler (CRN) family protein n=1 Tax=Thraustotheca clavata TaxID=74557 RepID=A0A1V9ZC01_9STRA|nr:hypothetical protein THRCLA_22124 [Thraustotheca clavata]